MTLLLPVAIAAGAIALIGCTSGTNGTALSSPSLPITAVTDTATRPTATLPDTDLPTATDPANDCDVLCDSTLPSAPPGVDCSVVNCVSSLPGDEPTNESTDEPPPPEPKIIFKVTSNGTKSTSITYGIGTHIAQANGARLPWKKTVDDTRSFYSLIAQASNGTRITCEIDQSDGTVVDKNSSTGQYAVVSCSGSV